MSKASRHEWTRGETGSSRILPFSDGVFAIAITLLAMQIDVPINIPLGRVAQELPGRLLHLWPMFESFVISFLVIGVYWVSHHRMFRYIRRYDPVLIWLNIGLLLLISFLPFPTELLGTYGPAQLPVIFYAASLLLTGVLQLALWLYATHHHHLVDENLDARLIRFFTYRSIAVPAIFLISIPVTFVNGRAAEFVWILLIPALLILQRVYSEEKVELA